MDFEKTALNLNTYLDTFEDTDNWRDVSSKTEKCSICRKVIERHACNTETGLECLNCALENMKNCVHAETIRDVSLSQLRRAMSGAKGLRWRFFFLMRFEEIYKQEKASNYYSLEVLLIEQLGYVTNHPFAEVIRQLAFDACLKLGEEIMPLLTKLYRKHPWQFQINVVMLAAQINPAYMKVSFMLEEAAEHELVEVRLRVVPLLKDIKGPHYRWAGRLLNQMCYDPDPMIRELARRYAQDKATAKPTTAAPTPLFGDEVKKSKSLRDLYQELLAQRSPDHYKIEELITEIYTVNILKKIAISLLVPLFKDNRLVDYDNRLVYKLRKKELVTIFASVLLDNNLFQQMLVLLPDRVREIFETLVWTGGNLSIEEVQKQLGKRVVRASRGGYYAIGDIIDANLLLFQFNIQYNYFSGKYAGYIYLDDRLRKILKRYFPMPQWAILKSLAEIPDTPFAYSDNNQFAYQVDIFLEFLRQGNIQYAKTTGKVLKSSLKKFKKYFHIKEFFSEERKDLAYHCSDLIINFLIQAKHKSFDLKNVKAIKRLLVDYFIFNNFKNFSFLDILYHISNYYQASRSLEPRIRESFFKLLKELGNHQWISAENLLMHLKSNYEEYQFPPKQEIANSLYLDIAMENFHYGFRGGTINHEVFDDVFFVPLVKAMFFLFGALGLVQLAYDYPKNEKYRLRDRAYLSPFDGLKYVKLSDFGKYVVGISESCDLKIDEQPTRVVLDERRLIVTLEGNGRLERLILDQFAEPISKNYYKITPQSFFKNCLSKNDIKKNIAIFKDRLTSELPPIWDEFFEAMENKINPLQYRENLKVFKIKVNKELISLIANDKILKDNVLKVEDYHIAIEEQNLNKVKKRLREYGFFIDNF